MLDWEISKQVDILHGVAQGCTLSPNLFKVLVYIKYMIVAVESTKHVESRWRKIQCRD